MIRSSTLRCCIPLFLQILLLLPIAGCAQDKSFVSRREAMVQLQIADRGIKDTAVLSAMRTVPRHLFVPELYTASAYEDYPLPIGYGQTISQPYVVAFMTERLQPRRGDRILEVGTGSGYQAAVLAKIVDSVFTIEIVGPLAADAEQRLRTLHYANVVVRHGDGYAGWPEHAPFDGIIVTAATDQVPQPLINQLKDGGRMVIPLGDTGHLQMLTVIQKTDGRIVSESVGPVRFVPLTRDQESN